MIVPVICPHCEDTFNAFLDVEIGQLISPFDTWDATCPDPDCGYSFPVMNRAEENHIYTQTSKWEVGFRVFE